MQINSLAFAALLMMEAAGASAQAPDAPAAAGRAPDGSPLTAKAAKALAGRTAGKPESCIRLHDVRSSQIVDESAIIYEISRKRWMVNFPAGGCAALRSDRAIVTRTPSDQLCRGDIARIIDPPAPIEFGSCGLGDFVPYTR